jgi:hypothetical protein
MNDEARMTNDEAEFRHSSFVLRHFPFVIPGISLSSRDGAGAPPRRSVKRLRREAPADAVDPVTALPTG